jgi:LPXTG-motif cell wall-anchored protein
MAMDPMDREPNVYNRETNVYDNTGRGSNTLAYVIGGLVIALGLLAFLFYDGGSNEPSTTGSTGTQTESTAPRAGSGATGGSSTAPATPTTPAPAAPAAPAPQQ